MQPKTIISCYSVYKTTHHTFPIRWTFYLVQEDKSNSLLSINLKL